MTSLTPTRLLALRVAAGLALVPAAALTGATPALAHAELVTAEPSQGATATQAPEEVSVTFSGDLIDGQGIKNLVQVRDAHGNQWQSGDGAVDGPTLTVPLCPGLPNGAYDVAYRVVYSDGHSEEADYDFTVADPSAPAEGTSPQGCGVAAAGGAPGAATSTSDAAGNGVSAAPAADPAPSAPADAGVPGWIWPVGIGGVLVLLLGLLALRGKARSLGHLDAGRADLSGTGASRPDADR